MASKESWRKFQRLSHRNLNQGIALPRHIGREELFTAEMRIEKCLPYFASLHRPPIQAIRHLNQPSIVHQYTISAISKIRRGNFPDCPLIAFALAIKTKMDGKMQLLALQISKTTSLMDETGNYVSKSRSHSLPHITKMPLFGKRHLTSLQMTIRNANSHLSILPDDG